MAYSNRVLLCCLQVKLVPNYFLIVHRNMTSFTCLHSHTLSRDKNQTLFLISWEWALLIRQRWLKSSGNITRRNTGALWWRQITSPPTILSVSSWRSQTLWIIWRRSDPSGHRGWKIPGWIFGRSKNWIRMGSEAGSSGYQSMSRTRGLPSPSRAVVDPYGRCVFSFF